MRNVKMKISVILLILLVMCQASACGTETAGNETKQAEKAQSSTGEPQEEQVTNKEMGLNEAILESGSVAECMMLVTAEDIDSISVDYDKDIVAGILNEASKSEVDSKEAEKLGVPAKLSEEPPNDTPWWIDISIAGASGYVGSILLSENEKTDITIVTVESGGSSRTAFFRNKELYDLVRRSDEAKQVIDSDSFEKYGAKAEQSVNAIFDSTKEEYGFTDIKLVHFEKVWEGKDNDGNPLELYDYEYSFGVENPETFELAGGMRFDYEMRVRTGTGFYGQIAVKKLQGQVIDSKLLAYDEMIYIEDDDRAIKDKIASVLG